MKMVPIQMQSQQRLGYEYSYENGSNSSQVGNSNRTKRVCKMVLLKSVDDMMTETAPRGVV